MSEYDAVVIDILNHIRITPQSIDYSKVVEGKDLDLLAYEQKFRAWDYVSEYNLLEHPDKVVSRAAMRLLDDLTIYVYAFFKDPDTDLPFKLTAYQDAIAYCALQHDFTANSFWRYILFKAANQIGKSALLIFLTIKLATSASKNTNIVLISKSLPQSQFLLAQMRNLLDNSKFGDSWREDVGETSNTTIITFEQVSNGRKIVARIICAPAGEGSLGYPIHYLFPDEVDFYEDSKRLFWKVLFARTKKTKGQIIAFSNPNPDITRDESLLWDLWNGDLFKLKFHFNFLDAPWNSVEEYERDKANSPSYIFCSTHDGDFPDDMSGAFFKDTEIKDMLKKEWINALPIVNQPIYIAMDTAKMRDQFVIGIGLTKEPLIATQKYLDLEVPYIEVLPVGTPYDDALRRVKEIKEEYKDTGIAVMGYDATGQKTFGDMARITGVNVTPVDFSRKETNKTQLYADFKMMAEQRKIKVVYSRQAENQLSGLRFKLTASKKYSTVEADKESTHDDICDMLAIMISIAVKPTRFPVTLTVVQDGQSKPVEQEEHKILSYDEASAVAMKQAVHGRGRGPY